MAIEIKRGLSPAETKAYIERLVEIERQQMEQRRRQQEMLSAQEAMRKEQERQAAEIEKVNARLSVLEQKVALAEREIAHYKPILESLRKQEEELDNRIWYLEGRGLPCGGYKKQLEQVTEKAFRTETKILKAQYDRDNALSKM